MPSVIVYGCPRCGVRGEMRVAVSAWHHIGERGDDYDQQAEASWDSDSAAKCKACGFEGVVQDFEIDLYLVNSTGAVYCCPNCASTHDLEMLELAWFPVDGKKGSVLEQASEVADDSDRNVMRCTQCGAEGSRGFFAVDGD